MKRTHIIAALTAALVAVIGTVLTGCASMQLVSLETDTVDGPKQVRQGYDINPREITVWGIFKDGSRKTVNISNTNITFDKNTPGTQTVKVRVSGQEATFQTQVMPLRTLTVSSPPKIALFKVGQEPDATWPGLEIRGEWDQMGGEKIPLASCEITGYRKEQAGKQTIRVAYMGLTAAFDVDVRAMTSIVIAQAPTKIDYVQGETLNLAGLRVTGVWEGFPAETLAVTASDVTGFNTNNVGIQHVTVTKNGKSAIFDVEVMALTSIEVDKPPTKTDYKMGEALDLTGIMVYGNYTGANPNKKKRELIPVSQLTTSGYEPNRIGKQQRVTVTVRGQNANFFVNIDLAPAAPAVTQRSVRVEMISVPGGTFRLGQKLGTGTGSDVNLMADITLSGFSISKYEITQGQWQAVMGRTQEQQQSLAINPVTTNYGRGDNFPVSFVSWYDAIVFCNKLSLSERLSPAYRINNSTNPDDWGTVPSVSSSATWNAVEVVSGSNGYRLPTGAQWEYAAKGGNSSAAGWVGYTFAGSDNPDDVAWYTDNSGLQTHAVGTKAPNRLGIYDMSGNVDEWCWDWMGYTSDPQTNPTGPASGSARVLRGGKWNTSITMNLRSVSRDANSPNMRVKETGFRVARPQ